MLRPGLRVFRRDDTHLQVGLDDPRLVVPDTTGVRDLLRDLVRGEGHGPLTPEAGIVLSRLTASGMLVEHEDAQAARTDRTGSATAVLAAHGPDAPPRLAGRANARIFVDAAEPWRSAVSERLALGGIAQAAAGSRPTATVLVTTGEPPRSRSDVLVRDDRPHLLLSLFPDRARLGPFVVPGRTACLRCLDAFLCEHDARRAVVLEQLEPAALPQPCDPVLAHAALALAARELITYAEGDRPATWSATFTVSADLGKPLRAWPRHPHCGCSWG